MRSTFKLGRITRQFVVVTTDNLAVLFAIINLDRIAGKFWDWHYRLTEPEREQAADEFFCRAFGRERK